MADDVIGRAIIEIAPDFTRFRAQATSTINKIVADLSKKLDSLDGQKGAKKFDTAWSKAAKNVEKQLGKAATQAEKLERALAVDPSRLRVVASAAEQAADNLRQGAAAAKSADAALDGIDPADLNTVATAAETATANLLGGASAAAAVDAALEAIDPGDLAAVTGAAEAATGALGGTAGAAGAANTAIDAIDPGDLVGVASAAEAATGAVLGTAEAAVAADAALATIDATDLAGVATTAATASTALTGMAGSSAAAAAGTRRVGTEAALAGTQVRGVGTSSEAAAKASRDAARDSRAFTTELSGLKTAGLVTGGVLIGLTALGVKAAGQFEQTRIAFKGLLGSQEAADEFLGTLREFAAGTPFEFEDIVPATQKLIALGQTGEGAIDTLTKIGNAASAVGADGVAINGVVLAISQMQAKGKLMAQELNQIAERLPNFDRKTFYANLAEDLDTTVEAVQNMQQNGEITSDMGMAALLRTFEELPGAMGAMDRQSETLAGRMSRLREETKFALTDAFQPLAKSLVPALDPISDAIGGFLTNIGGGLNDLAQKILPVVVPMLEELGPIIGNSLRSAAEVMGPFIQGFIAFLRVIGPIAAVAGPLAVKVMFLVGAFVALNKTIRITNAVLNLLKMGQLQDNLGQLAKTVGIDPKKGLSGAFTQLKAAAVKAFSVIMAHPFILAIGVIAGAFYLMYKNSEKLREAVANLGRIVMAFLTPAFNAIKGLIGGVLGVQIESFGDILGALGDKVAVLVEWLNGHLFKALGWMKENLAPIGEAIGRFAMYFANIFQQGANLVKTLLGFNDVAQGTAEVVDNMLGNTGGFIDYIRSAAGYLLDLVEPLKAVATSLFEFSLLGNIIDLFRIFGAVLSGDFGKAGDIAKEALSQMWEALQALPGQLLTLIQTLLDSLDGIFNVGRLIAEKLLGGLVESLKDIPVVGDIASAIYGLIQASFDQATGVVDILAGIFNWDMDRVMEGVTQLGMAVFRILTTVLPGIFSGLGTLLSDILSPAFANLGNLVKDIPIIGDIGKLIFDTISGGLDVLGNVGDLLAGIFTFDGDKILGALGGIVSAIGNWLIGLPGRVLGFIGDVGALLGGVFTAIGDWVAENAPGFFESLKDLPEIIGNLIKGAVTGLWDIIFGGSDDGGGKGKGGGENENPVIGFFKNMLGGAVEWIVNDAGPTIGKAIGTFVSRLPSILGGIFGGLLKIVKTIIPGLLGLFLDWLGDLGELLWNVIKLAFDFVVTQGPGILMALGSWLASLPGWFLGMIGDLGGLLLGWFVTAFEFIASNSQSILGAIGDFIMSIPGWVLTGLVNLGAFLLQAFISAGEWVVTNGPAILSTLWDWITTIPGWIVEQLANLGILLIGWLTSAWDWVVLNGPIILAGIWNWLSSLPGQFIGLMVNFGQLLVGWITGAWNWVVQNGPIILAGIWNWVKGIPGKLINLLGDIGQMIWGWLKKGFDWVVTKGPEILAGLLNWFKELPGKLMGAIGDGLSAVGGAAVDIGGKIWNAVKGFLNDKLIRPLRKKEISALGVTLRPFEVIPELAKGAIITRPTTALIGEAGPEVVIPLSDADRARELVVQSGLLNIIQEQPTAVTAAATPALDLPVIAPDTGTTPLGEINVPAPALPSGIAITPPSTSLDTAPITASVTSAMTSIVTSASDALKPMLDWFTNFTPAAITALTPFGPTVWAATMPSFQFFVTSFLTLWNTLTTFLTQWPAAMAQTLAPFGTVIWTAMAPAVTTLRNSIRVEFDGISSYLRTWQDGIKTALGGLPTWAGGIASQIANALKAPFRTFASDTWNPFASKMTEALKQIPATAGIKIPVLPTAHEGGVVGDKLRKSGGPLSASELVVKMKKGEGVLPTEVMAKLAPGEFEALRRGQFDRVFGERDPRLDHSDQMGAPATTGSAPPSNLPVYTPIPESLLESLRAAADVARNSAASLLNSDPYTSKYLGGLGSRAVSDALKFAEEQVAEANKKALAAVGGGDVFAGGVPADMNAAIAEVAAWRGRPGSYKTILRYMNATKVPHRPISMIRPGAVTRGSGGKRQSNHAIGRAVDFAGLSGGRDTPELLRIYNAFAPVAGMLAERLYSGPGGGYIKNPITRADHHDHVHIGLAEGAVLNGITNALVGEAGPEARVRLSDVNSLVALASGRSASVPVIDSPTYLELGNRPEAILPLTRPDRLRELSLQALNATATGRQAIQGGDMGGFANGGIFKPTNVPRRINSVNDISFPDGYIRHFLMAAELAPALRRMGTRFPEDVIMGDSVGPDVGGRSKADHLRLIKAAIDAGYRGTFYEDGSGRVHRGGNTMFFEDGYGHPNAPAMRLRPDQMAARMEVLRNLERWFGGADFGSNRGEGGFVDAFNRLPAILQERVMVAPAADPLDFGPEMVRMLSVGISQFANGGYVQRPTFGMFGEDGPEVIIPLDKPSRALQLANETGLIEVLEAARGSASTPTSTPQSEPTVDPLTGRPATTYYDDGVLGGGPGNTYNIYGLSESAIMAKIRARERADMRKNKRRW